jgi:hypothetical protein
MTLYRCVSFHTFRSIVVPSSSRSSSLCLTLRTKALRTYETSGTIHPTVQRHIPHNPAHLNLQQDRCVNLKSITVCSPPPLFTVYYHCSISHLPSAAGTRGLSEPTVLSNFLNPHQRRRRLLLNVCSGSKFCLTLLETVGLRVPNRNFRNFKLFC